jgi:hypothetical protein
VADVWFAKDTAAAANATAAANAAPAPAPALGDLLAAPADTLLPGHAANTANAAIHAHAAHAPGALDGLLDHRLLGDDEHLRHAPLF